MTLAPLIDVWIKYGRFDDEALADHLFNMPLERLIFLQNCTQMGFWLVWLSMCMTLIKGTQ